ncbi:hypothetical protein JSE7799_03808 [Jannaschia seosinensis]|uniref:Uncharacterized protein n=1 Tax=Jannaschia seosinensis TaxID=313367 RepID=A0A0M7BI63_9RHOB|nr:hypothetical protein [Jannaschia seosinensis]CUH41065.1 hypothetical protein JSE7799_03808 [Jannaschia seosinensis]
MAGGESGLRSSLIEQFREPNERLLEMLTPRDQEPMRSDARWWSAEAYAGRKVEDWRPQPPNPEELDALAVRLVELAFAQGRRP